MMANERYWLETLGCPKNQVDSDKLAGTAGGGRLPTRRRSGRRRPRRGQHLCVHRGGPPGVHRHHPRRSASIGAAGARLVVTGCMAERYGDELAAALPEVDLVAGFGVPCAGPSRRRSRRTGRHRCGPGQPRLGAGTGSRPSRATSFDLLKLPRRRPRAPWAYVKVAEGCDRRVRVLRHPVVPGQAAVASPDDILDEVEPSRRGRRGRRDRPRGPGPGLLRPGPHPRAAGTRTATSAAAAAGERSRRRSSPLPGRRRAGAADPAALPLPVGARPTTSSRPSLATGVPVLRPVAAARVAAPAGPDAAVGRRRPVPRAHRADPGAPSRRRVPVLVHPRLPGRDRGGPRRAARVPARTRSSTGPGSSPSPPRTGPTPPTWPDQVDAGARARAPAGVRASCRTPSRPRRRDRWSGRPRGAGRRRRGRRTVARGARDRRRRPRARDTAGRVVGRRGGRRPRSAPMSSPSPFDRTPAGRSRR